MESKRKGGQKEEEEAEKEERHSPGARERNRERERESAEKRDLIFLLCSSPKHSDIPPVFWLLFDE